MALHFRKKSLGCKTKSISLCSTKMSIHWDGWTETKKWNAKDKVGDMICLGKL